jgi:hypothetical protein
MTLLTGWSWGRSWRRTTPGRLRQKADAVAGGTDPGTKTGGTDDRPSEQIAHLPETAHPHRRRGED